MVKPGLDPFLRPLVKASYPPVLKGVSEITLITTPSEVVPLCRKECIIYRAREYDCDLVMKVFPWKKRELLIAILAPRTAYAFYMRQSLDKTLQ